jgi:hypothetical protein
MMKTPKFRNLALLSVPLILVLAGCADSPSSPTGLPDGLELTPGNSLMAAGAGVVLLAEAESFEAGAPVLLRLENHSNERVGFNLCAHGMERRIEGEWSLAPTSAVCTMHLSLAEPGDTAEYTTTLPQALPAGEYRFRIALYLMNQEELRDQVSNGFVIDS